MKTEKDKRTVKNALNLFLNTLFIKGKELDLKNIKSKLAEISKDLDSQYEVLMQKESEANKPKTPEELLKEIAKSGKVSEDLLKEIQSKYDPRGGIKPGVAPKRKPAERPKNKK